MIVKFRAVKDKKEIITVARMADRIIHEFYDPLMPISHVSFFIKTFQSEEAVAAQLSKGFDYFLIVVNGINKGYLSINYQNDKALISKLYILSAERKSGIGTIAMNYIKKEVIQHGIDTIELFVNHQNYKAISFYETQFKE